MHATLTPGRDETQDTCISPAQIIAEQEAQALSEIRDWRQVADAFVMASEGNRIAAERLFDLTVDRLIDSGALSTRAYRGILAAIHDGE